jgi:virulence activator alpha
VFCLWVLPTEEALECLARDRAEYVRHLAYVENVIATRDWIASPVSRASRLSIEFGRRFYAMQIEWIDGASEQVQQAHSSPGGAPPGLVSAVTLSSRHGVLIRGRGASERYPRSVKNSASLSR